MKAILLDAEKFEEAIVEEIDCDSATSIRKKQLDKLSPGRYAVVSRYDDLEIIPVEDIKIARKPYAD